MPAPPRYIRRFADSLRSARVTQLSVEACRPPVEGIHGILTTSRLQYSEESWQLLGRKHEYTLLLPNCARIEISIQLYLDFREHWRLFAFCKGGLLLSVNLTKTKGKGAGTGVVLQQDLRLSTRAMTKDEREAGAEELAGHLSNVGFEVSTPRRVVFGTFDGTRGVFKDTTPTAFVRDFVVAAALKGHFMANKGYELPGLRRVLAKRVHRPRQRGANQRAVPLGLRYTVLERDGGRCVLCGGRAEDGRRLHVDHIVPWSQGGRTELLNLQILCQLCNLGKGNRSTRSHR